VGGTGGGKRRQVGTWGVGSEGGGVDPGEWKGEKERGKQRLGEAGLE